MLCSPVRFTLSSPDETTRFARRMAPRLRAGDVILLEGGIGAGKTCFARALIQSLLITPEDVPSPTFTLVQTYDTTAGEIWHADLYRISHPDEIGELALETAFEDAICLIEWPGRMGNHMPSSALTLHLETTQDPGARNMTLTWNDPRWNQRLEGIENA